MKKVQVFVVDDLPVKIGHKFFYLKALDALIIPYFCFDVFPKDIKKLVFSEGDKSISSSSSILVSHFLKRLSHKTIDPLGGLEVA